MESQRSRSTTEFGANYGSWSSSPIPSPALQGPTFYGLSLCGRSGTGTVVARNDTIVDRVNPSHGTFDQVNTVDHTHVRGACVKIDFVDSFAPKLVQRYPDVYVQRKKRWFSGKHWVKPLTLPNLQSEDVTAWDDLAISLADKLQSNLRAHSLLGVTLAELGKTARMVKNPFSLFTTNWRSVATGFWSGAQLAKKGASLWLEGQYGWKSAYLDLKGFTKSFEKLDKYYADAIEPDYSRRFSASREIVGSTPSSNYSDQAWSGYISTCLTSGNTNRGWCRLKYGPPTCKMILQGHRTMAAGEILSKVKGTLRVLGADKEALLTSLWELVPYSFVVDWFLDTESLIRYWSAARFLHSSAVRDLCWSTKQSIEWTAETINDSHYGMGSDPDWSNVKPIARSCIVAVGEAPGYYKRYRRGLGIPILQPKLIDFDLSSTQIANGMALLVQRAVR